MSAFRRLSVRFALFGLLAGLLAFAAPSAFARSSWSVSIGGPGYGVGYASGWGGHGYGYGYVGGGYGYGYGGGYGYAGGYYPAYGYSNYYGAYPAYYGGGYYGGGYYGGGYYGGYPAYAPAYPSVVYYDRPVARPYYKDRYYKSSRYGDGYGYHGQPASGQQASYYDRGYRD